MIFFALAGKPGGHDGDAARRVPRILPPLEASRVADSGVSAAERALVERLRTDDEQAFRAIFDSQYEPIARFIARHVTHPDAAEDILQSTFAVLWMRRATLDAARPVAGYLVGVARKLLITDARRQRVRQKAEPRVLEVYEARGNPEEAADVALLNDEMADVIRAAVASLPPRRREILLMNRADGLTPAQIAAALGIQPQVVYNQLSRALRTLAVALESYHMDR